VELYNSAADLQEAARRGSASVCRRWRRTRRVALDWTAEGVSPHKDLANRDTIPAAYYPGVRYRLH